MHIFNQIQGLKDCFIVGKLKLNLIEIYKGHKLFYQIDLNKFE